jgi:hypothetical protein
MFPFSLFGGFMEIGKLSLLLRVVVPDGENTRCKKVNLCNFYIAHDEVVSTLSEFKSLNPDIKHVEPIWTYSDYFDYDDIT